MEINVKSMIGYTTYMQNRMPSMDMTFSVTEDGHLQMAKFVQEGDVMRVVFLDEDHAEFEYATPTWSVKKTVDRGATFNGAMIEFMTHGRDHFLQIHEDMEKCPNMMRQYEYIDTRRSMAD